MVRLVPQSNSDFRTRLPHLTFRLEPFSPALRSRYAAFQKQLNAIEQHEGGIAQFSEGYKTMGFQVDQQGGVKYREWAPGAAEARLIGDFSEYLSSTFLLSGY
jgi:hypothetical protein